MAARLVPLRGRAVFIPLVTVRNTWNAAPHGHLCFSARAGPAKLEEEEDESDDTEENEVTDDPGWDGRPGPFVTTPTPAGAGRRRGLRGGP